MDFVTVFILGGCTALFVRRGFCFLRDGKGNRLKTLVGIILIVNSLFLLKDLLYYVVPMFEDEPVYSLMLTMDNWVVVLDAMYALELVRPGYINIRKFFLNISLFLVFTVMYAVTGSEAVFNAFLLFTVLYAAFLLGIIYLNMRKYGKVLKELHSDLTYVSVNWVWTSVVLLLVLLGLWLIVYMNGTVSLDFLYYISMTAVWTVISFKTEKQQVPDKIERESVTVESIGSSDIDMASYHFAEKLEDLEKSGYFSAHPQITLTELSAELNTNRTTLSNYINRVKKLSFYDYINESRLKRAEELVVDGKLTQEEIAIRSGFNSISTFRRAFHKKYGVSPNDYRKKYKQFTV